MIMRIAFLPCWLGVSLMSADVCYHRVSRVIYDAAALKKKSDEPSEVFEVSTVLNHDIKYHNTAS